MNSALELTQGGLPRRCVCGSRLSSARTFQPLRTSRSVTCEPMRPAAPVTSARFSLFAISGRLALQLTPYNFFRDVSAARNFRVLGATSGVDLLESNSSHKLRNVGASSTSEPVG